MVDSRGRKVHSESYSQWLVTISFRYNELHCSFRRFRVSKGYLLGFDAKFFYVGFGFRMIFKRVSVFDGRIL